MEKLILVKCGELYLKGLNRPYFEYALIRNMKKAVPGITVQKEQGRMYVRGFDDLDAALNRLSKVFGIYALCPAYCMDIDLDAISVLCNELVQADTRGAKTFKVEVRRQDKRFPMTSPQIAAQVGGYIYTHTEGIEVDVHHPQLTVNVELREKAYIFLDTFNAMGGMPVGTGGKAMLLLSGGIDSPVAGWMLSKRGVELDAIHYYSFPYTGEQAKQKVIDLANILSEYSGPIRLHVVPFTKIQEEIYQKCPHEQLTLIMRRFMMRIAEETARRNHCGALVTGESLGQVASQTFESIIATDAMVDMPVYRPLIGFDKLEIIERAVRIGTYETSILPYEDCCTVFTPKHPVTKPNIKKLQASEALLDFDALVTEAVENIEVISIGDY